MVAATSGIPLLERKIVLLKKLVKGISINIDFINYYSVKGFYLLPQLRKVITNKIKTVKLLKKHNVPFIINTTLYQQNITELESIAQFATSHGAQSLNLFSLVPLGRGHDLYNLIRSGYDDIITKVLEIKARYKNKLNIITKCAPQVNARIFVENPENMRIFEGNGGCPAGISYMYISAEGYVLPCPYFPLKASLGNVKNEKLSEILTNDVFKSLRARDFAGKCNECEFSYICSGCRARAYIVNGDYIQADPLCDYQPKGGTKIDKKW